VGQAGRAAALTGADQAHSLINNGAAAFNVGILE
jgi:hypothetical protein